MYVTGFVRVFQLISSQDIILDLLKKLIYYQQFYLGQTIKSCFGG